MLHRKYTYLLVVLCQLLGINTFSQEVLERRKFVIYDLATKSIFDLDLEHQIFFMMNQEARVGPFKLNFENVKIEDIDQNIHVNCLNKFAGEFYLSIAGTGQIYTFNPSNHVFKRLDKTFYRGFNFYSIPVARKDSIYSLGGYGFWHINNVLTYYDKKLNEWEQLQKKFSEYDPARIVSKFGGYHPIEDKIFAAEIKDPYSEKELLPIPFFQFDFKNRSWLKLGTIKSLPTSYMQYDHLDLLWTGQFFFSHDFTSPHFIDPVANKHYKYMGNKKSFFSLSVHLESKGAYLYSFLQLNNKNQDKILVDSISVKSLLKDSAVLGTFYQPVSILDGINYYLVGIVFLVFMLIIQFFKIRKNKLIQSFHQGLVKSIEFPEYSQEFLRFMFNRENHICSTEELNAILNCSDKSIENQRQIRSKFISTLNLWIEIEFQVPEAIGRISSEHDKRFVNYTITTEGLRVLDQIFRLK
ncbi:MAG: hypothetical protein ACKOWQ_00470 [Aquirufa sp.]